jgi:hypothetical protein
MRTCKTDFGLSESLGIAALASWCGTCLARTIRAARLASGWTLAALLGSRIENVFSDTVVTVMLVIRSVPGAGVNFTAGAVVTSFVGAISQHFQHIADGTGVTFIIAVCTLGAALALLGADFACSVCGVEVVAWFALLIPALGVTVLIVAQQTVARALVTLVLGGTQGESHFTFAAQHIILSINIALLTVGRANWACSILSLESSAFIAVAVETFGKGAIIWALATLGRAWFALSVWASPSKFTEAVLAWNLRTIPNTAITVARAFFTFAIFVSVAIHAAIILAHCGAIYTIATSKAVVRTKVACLSFVK